jgi:hypothetical protein
VVLLICPAFDNKGTPYDQDHDEYCTDNQAAEEQNRIRDIATSHRDFLLQFKSDFDYMADNDPYRP